MYLLSCARWLGGSLAFLIWLVGGYVDFVFEIVSTITSICIVCLDFKIDILF